MTSRVPLRGLHRSRAGAGDSPAAVTHAAPREFSPAASPLTSLHVSRASVLVCEVHTALGCFLGWEGLRKRKVTVVITDAIRLTVWSPVVGVTHCQSLI